MKERKMRMEQETANQIRKNGKSELVFIGIEHIYPHPDNPRKNLGDLEELTESIRKNGVMQNLTVVPGHWIIDEEYYEIGEKFRQNPSEELREIMNKRWMPEGYTLIIGHRRHAAAARAGMKELPCRIIEGLSPREQLSTMLEENMQRNDLTIFEQAQGFQLMLNLGETEETIAEKTGFSKTTVRHRLNIAKLDQSHLQKKEQDESFQLSLKDLYALEQVEDIKIRNKILKEATSSRDLVWKAQSAAAEEDRNKKIQKIITLLEPLGIKKAPKQAEKEQYTGKWDTIKEIDLDKAVPKQIKLPKQEGQLYYLPYYRSVRVIKKAEKRPETSYEKERKEVERLKKEIKAKIKELNARKHDFIVNIIFGKIEALKEESEVKEAVWKALVHEGTYISESSMRGFFTGKADYDCTPEEKKTADKIMRNCSFLHQMLLMLNYKIDNSGDIWDWTGKYNDERGKSLLCAYRILERYGWSFKGDEKKLLDGTHELYTKATERAG